jgi:hypothetical protein
LVCDCSSDKNQYGGIYGWAGPNEGDPWGQLYIYPSSKNEFIFYLKSSSGDDKIDVQFGKAKLIKDNKYEFDLNSADSICKIAFEFENNYVKLTTDEENNKCSGKSISALREDFMKETNVVPEYFIDNFSEKRVYFKDLVDE